MGIKGEWAPLKMGLTDPFSITNGPWGQFHKSLVHNFHKKIRYESITVVLLTYSTCFTCVGGLYPSDLIYYC